MKPVLVLLPGMDGTGELFAPFIAALGDAFEVRVVRYPGRDCGEYQELEAFVWPAIPEDRPFVLLGESFSGPIAMSIAASAPEQLRGLVLCCTFARSPRPKLAAMKALIDVIPFKFLPSGWLVGANMRAAFRHALSQVTSAALRARMRAVLAVDARDKLAACEIPILYLRATRDKLVPRASGDLVAATVPATIMVEFDAPHFLLQAVPEQAAREVAAFVQLNARR